MKIPEIFLSGKNLDNKVDELLKENPLKRPQLNKDEIPRYAVQENGDYLIITKRSLTNRHGYKKVTSAIFYFTIDHEEHTLCIGNEAVTKLDEKFVSVEESLIPKLFEMGVTASYEPRNYESSGWNLEMKHATENAYKELVKLVNNA